MANDLDAAITRSLAGPSGNRQGPQRLDLVEEVLAFLFLDDISKEAAERADITAKGFLFDLRRTAEKLAKPLFLVLGAPKWIGVEWVRVVGHSLKLRSNI